MFALQARNNKNLLQLDNVELGLAGEAIVYTLLRNQGFKVLHTATEHDKKGDLRAIDPDTGEIIHVEVKTARKSGYKGRWHFCINKGLHTTCEYSDFIIFVVIDSHQTIFTYCSPASMFRGVGHFTISSHPSCYRGKLASFKQTQNLINFQSVRDTADLQTGRLQ